MLTPGKLTRLVHLPLRGKAAIAFLVPWLLSCDARPPLDPSSVGPLQSLSASAEDLGDAALFVGNLIPGVQSTNGVLRYDAYGHFIDKFTPGGCCMTFGPGEDLYVVRQQGIHRYNGVTGAFMGVFVAPDPNATAIAFIPVLGPDGLLYVSDRGEGQSIRRYDASGNLDPDFYVDGAAAGMSGSQYFAFGPDGYLYFTSVRTSEVLRFSSADGAYIDRFVESGEGGLVEPSGLTFGPDGILYVGSPTTDRVLRFDRQGAYIGDFFPAGSGGLDTPVGITFGPDGNFYVAGAATPQSAGVFRYNGTTGAFMDAFVGPGDGVTTGPRTLQFKATISVCHAPPGNPENRATITIGYLSARDHVDHGDAVGPCVP